MTNLHRKQLLDIAENIADLTLSGAGIICIAALLYFAYHFSWTGQRHFAGWPDALLWYGCPTLLAGIFFASLRLGAVRKINLTVLLYSTAASLYAAEMVLTVWSALPSTIEYETRQRRAAAAEAQGVKFDIRTREQVVDDLRQQGLDAVPSIFGQAFLKSSVKVDGKEILPLGGVSNKLVVLCNEAGQYVTYRSDSHGFNNPDSVWRKAPIDIVVLGDSYAQGYCVPPDQTFVARIRARYPATLNLGMEGNGPLLMLASLKEYAETFKPRMVLWFYFEGNDPADLSAEAQNPILRDYLNESGYRQGLMDRQVEIDRALLNYLEALRRKGPLFRRFEEAREVIKNGRPSWGWISNLAKLSELRDRLGLVYAERREANKKQSNKTSTDDRNRALLKLFTQVMLTAKQDVASWGGKLYFVYLPAWEPYGDPERATTTRGSVLKIVETLGLPVIDVNQIFSRQPDPLDLFPFRLPAHYNEKGNRLVAQEVLRQIATGK